MTVEFFENELKTLKNLSIELSNMEATEQVEELKLRVNASIDDIYFVIPFGEECCRRLKEELAVVIKDYKNKVEEITAKEQAPQM